MAEDLADGEAMPPLSSFRGRLDIHNFKFTPRPGDQAEAQKSAGAMPRFSERLLSKIDKSFKLTKPDANSKTTSLGTKKRKVNDVKSSAVLEDTATAPGLGGRTGLALLSTTKRSKNRKTATDRQMFLGKNKLNLSKGNDSLPIATTREEEEEEEEKNIKKKMKRTRSKSGYAPPSTFAHLSPLPDAMAPNLFVLFCGLNPGIQTAISGHAYSSHTNRFWKIMHSSGVLPVPCVPEEDSTLPGRFRLGLTNIVERPSRNGAQLSKAEMDAGVPVLEEKVRRWRPEVVCLVGKSIWESVWRVHHGGKAVGKAFHQAFEYGWQDESENIGTGDVPEKEDGVVYVDDWKGARVFVASSTSGLAATLSPAEKERIWRELGVWVEARRAQAQAEAAPRCEQGGIPLPG